MAGSGGFDAEWVVRDPGEKRKFVRVGQGKATGGHVHWRWTSRQEMDKQADVIKREREQKWSTNILLKEERVLPSES